MAQIQLPPASEPDQETQNERQADDSWVRTPPGGPQVLDKQSTMDLDAAVMSLSPQLPKPTRPSHGFAMDDLEAAETLAGFARQNSPPAKNTPNTPFQPLTPVTSQISRMTPPQSEPLLSLLTSQHPLIGSAINGSLSAYNVGKTYSSQFRYGAEFVERNIASPVASTVGTAGRITGVENGVRRWLSRGRNAQGSEPSSAEDSASPDPSSMSPSTSTASHKRRRSDDPEAEGTQPAQRSRAASEISISQGEYLPAYDANRSPTYSSRDPYPPLSPQQHSLGNSTWQTRLILSTSGLGIAMSGESRRSLKYCLRWLRWGNGRLGRLVYSLQSLLAEYEAAGQRRNANGGSGSGIDGHHQPYYQPRDQAAITAQMAALRAECERVLKKSVDVVSNYTGGALPDNARALVHRHLTSLPQRFAFALRGERDLQEDEELAVGEEQLVVSNGSSSRQPEAELQNGMADGEKSESQKRLEVVRAAKRMVVLAREGLEMMGQVSLVIDSTITSAEEWCERLGRKIPRNENAEMAVMLRDSEAGPSSSRQMQIQPPGSAPPVDGHGHGVSAEKSMQDDAMEIEK